MKFKLFIAAAALAASGLASAQQTLLNASYDVAREFYKDINAAFVPWYKKTTGKDVKVDQSHGGSSAQARSVAEGLDADVVTMNTTTDVEFLAERGVVAKDWSDLVRPDVKVVVVNPKTGGNGRYAYLAAWGYVRKNGGTDAQAAEFVSKLYKNVPVLARGGRDATTAFLQRDIGDVLVTFESEVESVNREFGEKKVDVVYPSISIVAENPVAIVERTVAKKGSGELAKAYIDFLYSEQGQEIAARHSIRPRNAAVLKKHAATFKPVKLFTVQELFGSLSEAQKVHFNDGAQFDKLYAVK